MEPGKALNYFLKNLSDEKQLMHYLIYLNFQFYFEF